MLYKLSAFDIPEIENNKLKWDNLFIEEFQRSQYHRRWWSSVETFASHLKRVGSSQKLPTASEREARLLSWFQGHEYRYQCGWSWRLNWAIETGCCNLQLCEAHFHSGTFLRNELNSMETNISCWPCHENAFFTNGERKKNSADETSYVDIARIDVVRIDVSLHLVQDNSRMVVCNYFNVQFRPCKQI